MSRGTNNNGGTPATGGAPVGQVAAAVAAGAGEDAAAAPVVEKARAEAKELKATDLATIIATAVAQALKIQGAENMAMQEEVASRSRVEQAEMLKQVFAALGVKPVDDDVPPEDPAERLSELDGQLQEPRFLITIQKGDKYAMDPVPIGVNGLLRTIKRGDFAIVTESMLGVLRDSEETHIEPDTHEPYQVTSYPYHVHATVPKELWDKPALEVAMTLVPDRVRSETNRRTH